MSVWGQRAAAALGALVPAAVAMALLVACGKTVDARPSAPPVAVSARSVGDEPPPRRLSELLRPPADVPPDLGVQVRRAAPGRYASLVQYHQLSARSRGWADYASVSSVALELEPDGEARACRGQRSAHLAPGEHLRGEAQQGLSGRWRRDGSWIDVRLRRDDGVCSTHAVGLGRAEAAWHLRCLAVETDERPASFEGRALACRVAGSGERLGYAVPGVLPDGGWMLLGRGKGLHLRAEDDQTSLAGVMVTPDGRAIGGPGIVLDVGPAARRVDGESWREH